jgi:Tfp pilus assembly protein PilF
VAQQELNDLAGARTSYERALNIDPKQSGVMWNLALVLEQQGERQWAERLYGNIPEDAAEWCDATFRLGYLKLLSAEYAVSAQAFENCIAKRSDWPEAYLNAGIAYARSGNPEAARRNFQEALMLRPDSSDAVRGLAALALDTEDFAEAFDLHRRLIDLGEHSPELFYNAGLICQKRGQVEDAAQFYQQALQEDPQFAEALLNLGHALMSMGQEEEARSHWRRAIREKPELAQTYFEPPVV